jgi:hypothetical protein
MQRKMPLDRVNETRVARFTLAERLPRNHRPVHERLGFNFFISYNHQNKHLCINKIVFIYNVNFKAIKLSIFARYCTNIDFVWCVYNY